MNAGGAFLSGSLDFAATNAAGPKLALGRVSGDLTAHFDGLGGLQPAAGATTASISSS